MPWPLGQRPPQDVKDKPSFTWDLLQGQLGVQIHLPLNVSQKVLSCAQGPPTCPFSRKDQEQHQPPSRPLTLQTRQQLEVAQFCIQTASLDYRCPPGGAGCSLPSLPSAGHTEYPLNSSHPCATFGILL